MPEKLTGERRGAVNATAPGSAGQAIVVGGGIVGLSIARELAADGWSVTVFERAQPGHEASHAAAGMLVPALEFHDAPALRPFGEAARELYPDYVRELEAETGVGADLRLDGALALLDDAHPAANLPPGGELLAPDALRRIEPALAHDVVRAMYFPHDGSVDNRALVRALLVSCRQRGVAIASGLVVDEIVGQASRVRGVRCGEEEHQADLVVNCGGAWASSIPAPAVVRPVKPIMGQMILLDRALPGGRIGPERLVYSHSAYLVPRSDGRLVLGTTVEDRGFDKVVEAGAIARLLAHAIRLCLWLQEARWLEAWAGLRPLGSDATPTIGATEVPGYCVAIGHYRNGILLAPLTARAFADGLAGRKSRWSAFFRPAPA